MKGLEKTVKALQSIGLPILHVDTVLVAIAVNALVDLSGRDPRYDRAIKLVMSIVKHPPKGAGDA